MNNEKRAEALLERFGFAFDVVPKEEIRSLLANETAHYQDGSSEYIRLLCGYLYCIGDETDLPLLEHAKYGINMDVGCMIDEEWLESLRLGGQENGWVRSKSALIKDFISYYQNFHGEE